MSPMTTRCRMASSLTSRRGSRVLEALEDARLALREAQAALRLQDELARVIRLLHGRLRVDEGGVR